MNALSLLLLFGASTVTQAATSGCGSMTFFSGNGAIGRCGSVINDAGFGIALSLSDFESSRCGQAITVTANGRSVSGFLVDACPSCGSGSIDVSPAVFTSLGLSLDVGRASECWNM